MPVTRRPPPPRVIVDHVRPTVDGGALAAKAAVGLPLEVSADLVADGHDLLMAVVEHGPALTVPPPEVAPGDAPGAATVAAPPSRRVDAEASLRGRRTAARRVVPMEPRGNDRWAALITPTAVGPWEFSIGAIPDRYGTWARDLALRFAAGQEIAVELEGGARLAEAHAALSPRRGAAERRALAALAAQLRDAELDMAARVAAATHADTVALMRRTADWSRAARAGPFPLHVDRERAAFSAWYEMFPRSVGAQPGLRSGTLRDARQDLPRIAGMGFDIVYLPPIHPIGTTHRKGRNNTLGAEPGDPGSPWAIGSAAGGHTAVHADLGTLADVDAFVAAATRLGMEVALDLAIQCSPDHPWVSEHPQWFAHRPDGSIRHAENPPKRYQDIYPVDFDTDDWEALWRELRGVVRFWTDHGVRVFRVDNPHTKSLRFWRWLIADVQRTDPDVIFLAEAFTRPRVMERLAKLGFTQSYTYFTWRNTLTELREYLAELATTESVDWFRPNFWVNTPDILHEFLQRGGPPAFRLRAVLAAMGCPSWGMYSGYELAENVAVREGSEEYLDSEKYQYRPRDHSKPASIARLVTQLNGIRRAHPAAVSQLRTLRLHHVDGDHLLCFSRMDDARSDRLLVIVNLDPLAAHEGLTWLDLDDLGIAPDAAYEAHDELTDTTFVWQGPQNYVRLDPAVQPAHILSLRLR